MPNFKNIEGERFGKLTVLKLASRAPVKWLCQCDCGRTKTIVPCNLRTGASRSCGCVGAVVTALRNRTHGESTSPEYRIWHAMRKRCGNPKSVNFAIYGGRGIRVSESWCSFESFLKDMGRRPSPKHSIERKDNDGNYEPGNCRWATKAEQVRNMRSNVFVTHCGQKMCIADWADHFQINRQTLYQRIHRGIKPDEVIRQLASRLGIH